MERRIPPAAGITRTWDDERVRIGTSASSVRNVIARLAAVAGTYPVTDAESIEG
jgi:hypothetical protein